MGNVIHSEDRFINEEERTDKLWGSKSIGKDGIYEYRDSIQRKPFSVQLKELVTFIVAFVLGFFLIF